MSTLTKEWLLKTIAELEEERDAMPGAVNEDAAMALAAMKLALASLEAEAVGEVVLGEYDDCGCHPDARVVCIAADGQADWENFKDGTRLFTAPPTSVVNAEPVSFDALRDAVAEVSGATAMEWSDIYKGHQPVPFINFNSLARIVDKFRSAPPAPVSVPDGYRLQPISEYDAMCAAMLQGADGKPELTVWYGAMPESNGKANWTAILHRKGEGRCMNGFTIDRSEYPGRVLYAADRVRYLIGEKSERPSILDYDADAHSGYMKTGNSPVTPDGWVMVPEEPTHEMLEAGDEQFGTYDVYRRMIAASPQQK